MDDAPPLLTAVVSDTTAGGRLDRFLADAWPDLSRARVISLIQAGAVQVDPPQAKPLIPASKVRAGEVYIAVPPPPLEAEPQPEAIPLTVIYEDADLIVIDKPAGLTVHPAPGNYTGTLVNALLHHCGDSLSGIGGVRRPGIVHRIDKDTSGLLVVAKNDHAHNGLAVQFAQHTVRRIYTAYVWGTPAPRAGRIEGAIGRDPKNRKRMAITPGGKAAVTHYKVARVFGFGASEITCQLETGRTHQIRVHMTESGWPLIGDPLYGRISRNRKAQLPEPGLSAALNFGRQALHAGVIGFAHPRSNAYLEFEQPPSADLSALAAELAASTDAGLKPPRDQD